MNVLLTNDDGIYAEGIRKAYQYLKDAGHNVYVSAPATEQSGVSHSINYNRPLRVEEIYFNGEFFGYSINGSPADCVKIGYSELYKNVAFDFVISGLNPGENIGRDIYWSGTMAAAAEGTLAKIRSLAVSLILTNKEYRYDTGGKFIVDYIEKIKNISFPKDLYLNINIPNLDYSELNGYKYTNQGDKKYTDGYTEYYDERGKKHYWLKGYGFKSEIYVEEYNKNDDYLVVEEGYVSISPLNIRLTDKEFIEYLTNNA